MHAQVEPGEPDERRQADRHRQDVGPLAPVGEELRHQRAHREVDHRRRASRGRWESSGWRPAPASAPRSGAAGRRLPSASPIRSSPPQDAASTSHRCRHRRATAEESCGAGHHQHQHDRPAQRGEVAATASFSHAGPMGMAGSSGRPQRPEQRIVERAASGLPATPTRQEEEPHERDRRPGRPASCGPMTLGSRGVMDRSVRRPATSLQARPALGRGMAAPAPLHLPRLAPHRPGARGLRRGPRRLGPRAAAAPRRPGGVRALRGRRRA